MRWRHTNYLGGGITGRIHMIRPSITSNVIRNNSDYTFQIQVMRGIALDAQIYMKCI